MTQRSIAVPVALVDPTPVIRAGLRAIVESSAGRLRVVLEGNTAAEILASNSTREPAPVLLILGERGSASLEVVAVQTKFPSITIFTIGNASIPGTVALPATATARQILDALLKAAPAIKTPVEPSALANQVEKSAADPEALTHPLHSLSPREREVFLLIARGIPNREIAKKLFISARTVETHRARLIKKLQFASTADLIKYAVRHELVVE